MPREVKTDIIVKCAILHAKIIIHETIAFITKIPSLQELKGADLPGLDTAKQLCTHFALSMQVVILLKFIGLLTHSLNVKHVHKCFRRLVSEGSLQYPPLGTNAITCL